MEEFSLLSTEWIVLRIQTVIGFHLCRKKCVIVRLSLWMFDVWLYQKNEIFWVLLLVCAVLMKCLKRYKNKRNSRIFSSIKFIWYAFRERSTLYGPSHERIIYFVQLVGILCIGNFQPYHVVSLVIQHDRQTLMILWTVFFFLFTFLLVDFPLTLIVTELLLVLLKKFSMHSPST